MFVLSEIAKENIRKNWASAPWLVLGYCLIILTEVKNPSSSELESNAKRITKMIKGKEVSSADEFISVFEEKFLNV